MDVFCIAKPIEGKILLLRQASFPTIRLDQAQQKIGMIAGAKGLP
jgi:hypothetical protein